MEALEEQQYRLISPVLTLLSVLLKDCQEHGTSDPSMCTLLENILGHGNIKVRTEGISRLCEFGATILDDRLLEVFVRGLNDTLLYKTEGQSYGKPPGLIDELVGLFARAMENDQGFGKRLLETMHRLEPGWAQVPLLYLVVALRQAVSKIRDFPFQREELTSIKSLARKYSGTYSTTLKSIFETELIRTIVNTSGPIQDLVSLMEVLSELSVRNDGTCVDFRWNPVTVWLKNVVASSDAVEYVRYTCKSYTERNSSGKRGIKRFALAIALLHDAGIIMLDKSCPSREILNEWFSSLNGIEQRPYDDLEATLDVIDMISCLAELEAQRTMEPVSGLCRPYIGTIMSFLFKVMRNVPSRLNYENLCRYLCVLRKFLGNEARLIPEKQKMDYSENFWIESRFLLNHISDYGLMHCMCALYILELVQEKHECYGKILRHVPEIGKLDHDESHGVISEELASKCYVSVARLLRQSLLSNGLAKTVPEQSKELMASLSELLNIGGREMPIEIAHILSTILNCNGVEEETRRAFEDILAACWKSVFLDKHSTQFLTDAKALGEVIVDYRRIMATSVLTDQLLNDCEDTPFVMLHMLEKITKENHYSTLHPDHQNLLLSCLLYGHSPTKEKSIERELYVYISKNDFCPAEVDSNDERLIRLGWMNCLYQMTASSVEFVTPFFRLLINTLNKYAGKHYHSQSDVHRTKHRLMQAILIMEPALSQEDAEFLAKNLTQLIALDIDQPSVRLMEEWTLVRIFRQRIATRKILWPFFEQAIKGRPRRTISAARILYHLALFLTEDDCETALQYLLKCCFGSQINMCLYNQVAFERVYNHLIKKRSNEARYEFLYAAIASSLEDTRSRIAEDFFLYKLSPSKDYSFETILYELPRLSGMDPYEWIDPELFDKYFKTARHPLTLRNTTSRLTNTVSSIYQTARDDETGRERIAEAAAVSLADVQKKIDPSSCGPEVDPSTSAPEKGGIPVVASLIERPPKLEGPAKTCEIFQDEELVIGNSGHVRDAESQNLGVSADKCIQITEVKPSKLQELGKEEASWTLVEAEQTANSVPL